MNATPFLDHIEKQNMSARLFCILNDIHEIPKCEICGNDCSYAHLRSEIEGEPASYRFSRYCGVKCATKDSHIPRESRLLLENKEWLEEQRFTHRKPLSEIASMLNVTETTVTKYIKSHGMKRENYRKVREETIKLLEDREWLYDQYKVQYKTLDAIGKENGCYGSFVQTWIVTHGIESNPANSYPREKDWKSAGEKEMLTFIQSVYDGEIVIGERCILGGRELDIYLPDMNIAFEYNGVFHHSYYPAGESDSAKKGPTYHVGKTDDAKAKGVRVVHIWSYWWNYKKDIVKSMILSRLSKTEKIYARKCVIKEIRPHEKNVFLENNHIQGKDASLYKYGLFYDDKLVSVMTFSKSRYNKKYEWELSRFATIQGTTVVGGFSKLLTHFRKLHSGSIISYADRLHPEGNVYVVNGFTLTSINPPGYWYLEKNTVEILLHINGFRKNKIGASDNQTEWERMQELGYKKIYDCGLLVYALE